MTARAGTAGRVSTRLRIPLPHRCHRRYHIRLGERIVRRSGQGDRRRSVGIARCAHTTRDRQRLVDLAMPTQIRHNREVSATAWYFTRECCFNKNCQYTMNIREWNNKMNVSNSRFSPVWLYMCVCNELGRVNRLSHTLHRCFFWPSVPSPMAVAMLSPRAS